MKILLSPFHGNGLDLRNHMVMSQMTRSRAGSYLPNGLMAEYYAQRATAGLIITEGIATYSCNGRSPGRPGAGSINIRG